MKEFEKKGFIAPKNEDIESSVKAGYILGAFGGVRGDIINAVGDWTPFFPVPEDQFRTNLETNACVTFNTHNAIETLLEYKFGKKENYSDRALAIASETNPASGNDPHKVAETVRSILGCVSEDILPFSKDITTSEQFYSPNPLPKDIISKGNEWWDKWSFSHEWVFKYGDDVKYKHLMLKEALKRGTVAVSVLAWMNDGELYYKPKGSADSHWTQLLRFDGDNPIVGDSYPPYIKKLSSDYNFGYAKVYYLDENKGEKIGILSQIVDSLSKLIPLLSLWVKYSVKEMNNPPVPTPEFIEENYPVEPKEIPKETSKYIWDTPKNVRHSLRVICDEEGLSVQDKNILDACVRQESQYDTKIVSKPNKNGTRDYGLCQFNDGKNKQGVPYWIGPGAVFSSVDEVLNNPEKCIRVMAREFKRGEAGKKNWVSYTSGAYKKYL